MSNLPLAVDGPFADSDSLPADWVTTAEQCIVGRKHGQLEHSVAPSGMESDSGATYNGKWQGSASIESVQCPVALPAGTRLIDVVVYGTDTGADSFTAQLVERDLATDTPALIDSAQSSGASGGHTSVSLAAGASFPYTLAAGKEYSIELSLNNAGVSTGAVRFVYDKP